MKNNLTFLDLFAGAGGLSEGFVRAGFLPVAHVEQDKAACYTLKTRMAFNWLKDNNKQEIYNDYLNRKISRTDFYKIVPEPVINSVINEEINQDSLKSIFENIDKKIKQPLDLIIGGPPCQAYSVIGRSRDRHKMQFDERNYLFEFYTKFLKHYKPKYFLFENVTGLLSARSSDNELYFDKMKNSFKKAGYEINFKVLSASQFGILQNRKRVFIIGALDKKELIFPDPEIYKTNYTVSDIFSGLPNLQSDEGNFLPVNKITNENKYLQEARISSDLFPITWNWARPHTHQDLEIYKIVVKKWNEYQERLKYDDLPEKLKTHKNRLSFIDRFKVVASNLPYSHTIVAHIARDGHYYIHPDLRQNRSLTPREAARIQTFPDDFFFESVKETPVRTPAFRQIGNAVPPLLAQKIAEKLMELW